MCIKSWTENQICFCTMNYANRNHKNTLLKTNKVTVTLWTYYRYYMPLEAFINHSTLVRHLNSRWRQHINLKVIVTYREYSSRVFIPGPQFSEEQIMLLHMNWTCSQYIFKLFSKYIVNNLLAKLSLLCRWDLIDIHQNR